MTDLAAERGVLAGLSAADAELARPLGVRDMAVVRPREASKREKLGVLDAVCSVRGFFANDLQGVIDAPPLSVLSVL